MEGRYEADLGVCIYTVRVVGAVGGVGPAASDRGREWNAGASQLEELDRVRRSGPRLESCWVCAAAICIIRICIGTDW